VALVPPRNVECALHGAHDCACSSAWHTYAVLTAIIFVTVHASCPFHHSHYTASLMTSCVVCACRYVSLMELLPAELCSPRDGALKLAAVVAGFGAAAAVGAWAG
jgi:hypothetical protein